MVAKTETNTDGGLLVVSSPGKPKHRFAVVGEDMEALMARVEKIVAHNKAFRLEGQTHSKKLGKDVIVVLTGAKGNVPTFVKGLGSLGEVVHIGPVKAKGG